jgi:hypothetical protein
MKRILVDRFIYQGLRHSGRQAGNRDHNAAALSRR